MNRIVAGCSVVLWAALAAHPAAAGEYFVSPEGALEGRHGIRRQRPVYDRATRMRPPFP